MANETNIFSFGEGSDPMEKAREALSAVRQYQQDWQNDGVNRVYKYFNDIEGNWLDDFKAPPINNSFAPISNTTFSNIYKQLKLLGLSKTFIENVALPSWWKSEIEENKCEIAKLVMSLAKRLHLEINVFPGSSELSLDFTPIPAKKFKLQKKQNNPELFSYLSTSIANINLEFFDRPYIPLSADPIVTRKSILKKNSCVNLESLLDFCWNHGIPVIHFDFFDIFGKGKNRPAKSDGLVIVIKNRPVIIIGSSRKYSAWLLFILAHELGHIANGHLQEGILSDESFKDGVNDHEENVANRFSTQLLLGDIPLYWNRNLDKKTLLRKVQCLSEEHSLDPGTLILNYAWKTGHWGYAVEALKRLEPNANAPVQINTYYQNHFTSMDEEGREYLKRINVLAN